MPFSDILAKTEFGGYSAAQEASVRATLESIYNTPTGAAMLTAFVASDTIRIQFVAGECLTRN